MWGWIRGPGELLSYQKRTMCTLLLLLLQFIPASLARFPADAVKVPYVSTKSYYYRPLGHQTSTDDVLVACLASKPELLFSDSSSGSRGVERYLDLGCGIGSTLLLVHHNTRPSLSVGIEGQAVSYAMLSQTVRELPDGEGAGIQVILGDLREAVPALLAESSFDLITANPPFSKQASGGHCKDDQRTFARFEMRGGVEDYCMCAAKLLRPGGRFVLAFWHKEDGLTRVQRASCAAGLRVVRRVDVLAGKSTNTEPHISIFELDNNNFVHGGGDVQTTTTLDVRRDASNRLSRTYKEIQERLEMRPRPLKPTIGKMVHGQS